LFGELLILEERIVGRRTLYLSLGGKLSTERLDDDVARFEKHLYSPIIEPRDGIRRHHGGGRILATVRTADRTGVEMEALTAATVAGLAIVDMVKGVDRGVELREAKVVAKSGGRSGDWARGDRGDRGDAA